MMKSKINRHLPAILKSFFCLLLTFSAFSCSEENKDDAPSLPGIDKYEGRMKELVMLAETENFDKDNCDISLLAPDETVITRNCTHTRSNGRSIFTMTPGLKEGDYQLLFIEYPASQEEVAASGGKVSKRQFGLGSVINVSKTGITVKSSYNSQIGLSGSGTKTDPYIISSYDHLITLAHKVNSDVTNYLFTDDTYVRQIVDIDMDDACFFVDHRYGWEPIGNDVNNPFRGTYQGAKLSNMWCQREKSPAIGLFGYIHKASIDGVTIERGDFSGYFAVGSIAGASVTSGARRDSSNITNCKVSNSRIAGSDGSLSVGGILGIVDMNSQVMMYECSNDNSAVEGDYNVGGILGGSSAYSLTTLNNCFNSGEIKGGFSGAGGIVGTADTLYLTSCRNLAKIRGGLKYKEGDSKNAAVGTGGLAGGSGVAFVTGCVNESDVEGVEGVGGILGSNRVNGNINNGFVYNNAVFRYCSNSGNVSGKICVGGINGESQFGSFGVMNTGNVCGESYVGGIAGNTSVGVAHNAVNAGEVSGIDYVAGIVGKTAFGSIALDDNFGKVTATGHHAAGIVALGGNNTIIHYCGNHGDIVNDGGNYAGGLVGEIGDPREWTTGNIVECVFGAAEIVMAVAGPCIALAEHAVSSVSHALAMVIKISEFSFDMFLHATDTVLLSEGMMEIASGESSEEVKASVKAEAMDCATEIMDAMASYRTSAGNYNVAGLSALPLSSGHGGFTNSHVDWYVQSGNDEIFNDRINETREERMEEEEKVHKSLEIAHECIGAVCLVAGTVATIVATVASGGTAAAFMAAGVVIGIAGGVNAITKSCNEFESDVVVISQCVNSGDVAGGANAGALVGSLEDSSIISDCLVAGNGNGKEYSFVGHYGKWAGVERCLNVGTNWKDGDIGSLKGASAIMRLDGYEHCGQPFEKGNGSFMYIDKSMLNDASQYPKVDVRWNISGGSNTLWSVLEPSDDGVWYPVPAFSQMRK